MNAKNSEDLLYLDAIRAGNSSVENEFIRRKQKLVKAVVRSLFIYGGDMEDLIQEGMLGLLSAIRTFNPQKGFAFDTYAAKCIKHEALNAIEKAKKDVILNGGQSIEDLFDDKDGFDVIKSGDNDNPEYIVIGKLNQSIFTDAINATLNEHEKFVLQYYLRGFSYAGIAEKLGKSVKSIDNSLQKIKAKLSKFYSIGDFSNS